MTGKGAGSTDMAISHEGQHPPVTSIVSSNNPINKFLEWFGDLGIFFWQVTRAAAEFHAAEIWISCGLVSRVFFTEASILARKQSGEVHYVESGVKLLKTRENQRL
jgi:hypothetical protein